MSEHRPTVVNDPDQDGEALDADLLPEDFPEDRPLASRDWGTTEAEQARGESLSRKLRREEPDLSDTDDGGDEGDDDSPDILSVEEEDGRDREEQLVSIRGRVDRHGDDSGQPRGLRSAEEDAIHVVDRDADLERVTIRPLAHGDAEALIEAVRASRSLHHPWTHLPDDLDGVTALIDRPEDRHRSYVIECDDGMVGLVTASEIVMGKLCSAYLGFSAFEGFAGRGLMQAGLRLVLGELFERVGLHRVEANIQPGNARSIRLVERLGFRREGYSPDYLFIDGAWRDHERWALLSSDPR